MVKWEKVKLGDYLKKVKTGKLDANVASNDGKYPFFTCSIEPLKINTYSFDCECVLVAGNGDLNVKYYKGKFDAYQRTYILESKNDYFLMVRYLYYFMINYLDVLRAKTQGGIIKYIRLNNITDAIIPLPPLEEQKKIAERLDAVSDLLEKQKQLLAEQDNLIKSIFYDMFGDPTTNSKNWTTETIGELLAVLTDYHSNGSYETLKKNVSLLDEPNYALMVRTTDLEKNDFKNDVKYIDFHAYNYLEKSKIFGGEIIINKIGSAGKIYLMPYLHRPVSLAMNQFLLRFKTKINHIYVYNLLITDYYTLKIQEQVKGAVTKTITKEAIKSIIIPVPPLAMQQKFATIVEGIEVQKEKIKSSIAETQTLFASLMAKYFDEEQNDRISK